MVSASDDDCQQEMGGLRTAAPRTARSLATPTLGRGLVQLKSPGLRFPVTKIMVLRQILKKI